MDHINKLPAKLGVKLIYKAIEKREEEKSWQMWLTMYPYMNLGHLKFMPFSEFHSKQIQPISHRPAEEILKEVYEIRKELENK